METQIAASSEALDATSSTTPTPLLDTSNLDPEGRRFIAKRYTELIAKGYDERTAALRAALDERNRPHRYVPPPGTPEWPDDFEDEVVPPLPSVWVRLRRPFVVIRRVRVRARRRSTRTQRRGPPGRRRQADEPHKRVALTARRRSRSVPHLRIDLPLEGVGRFVLVAATHEDELRLRRWLRASSAVADLPAMLHALLDDLDDADQVNKDAA
jgi:hypothetical protein